MTTNRRSWLKRVGLGTAAVALSGFEGLALPIEQALDNTTRPILLRSNENPYGPSPLAKKAMAEKVGSCNRYCWDLNSELIAAIARKNAVAPENILTGAGSTEILDSVLRYASQQKGNLILSDPTYDYWTEPAASLGISKIKVPLTAEKRHDLDGILKTIRPNTRLIYICNPNNPTGTMRERNELLSFVEEATKKTLVMIDEAYLDFTDQESLGAEAVKNKRLIVVKTFSKIYGMAGARVGYGIAHADTITALSKLLSSPNGAVSGVSAAGALASLQDDSFVAQTKTSNAAVRKYTTEQLQTLGIPTIPSHTNFIYFSLANYTGNFFDRLSANNIMGTRIYEEQGKWSRISVGTMEEMQQFIRAIS